MRKTLLEMTQDILSELDSDEVNSISDTVESMQVARIIKNKYYDIISRGNLPEQQMLIALDSSSDSTRPTIMYIPEGVSKIEWIKYLDETTPPSVYNYVSIIPMDQFLDLINGYSTLESNVGSYIFTEAGVDFAFNYKNDVQPHFCTVIENNYILFDSYDSTLDTTLQSSKMLVAGTQVSPFLMTDIFIPDIEDNQFALLYNEAKSLAFYELKQTPNVKADQEIKRQWSSVSKNKSIANKPSHFEQLPDFGRSGRTMWGRSRLWMR